MARLRVAVAGLGRIGWQFHFREANEDERFDVVAVVDPEAERRAEAVAECPSCVGLQAFDELWSPDIGPLDVVAIATPTRECSAAVAAAAPCRPSAVAAVPLLSRAPLAARLLAGLTGEAAQSCTSR